MSEKNYALEKVASIVAYKCFQGFKLETSHYTN